MMLTDCQKYLTLARGRGVADTATHLPAASFGVWRAFLRRQSALSEFLRGQSRGAAAPALRPQSSLLETAGDIWLRHPRLRGVAA